MSLRGSKRAAETSLPSPGFGENSKQPRVKEEEEVDVFTNLKQKEEQGKVIPRTVKTEPEMTVTRVSKSKIKPKKENLDPDAVYEVEGFVRHRIVRHQPQLLTKWRGYNEKTWETVETLVQDVPDVVMKYAREKNLLDKPYWKDILVVKDAIGNAGKDETSKTANAVSIKQEEEDVQRPEVVPSSREEERDNLEVVASAIVSTTNSSEPVSSPASESVETAAQNIKVEDQATVSLEDDSATAEPKSAQVKQDETKTKLKEAKQDAMEKYADRFLLRRLQGISALGGNFVNSYAKPAGRST
jgi:hypothetical protein